MKKVILFSPRGYIGTYMKEALQRETEIELYEILRGSDLKKYQKKYDVMVYSAAVSDASVEQYLQDNVMTAVTMIDFCKKHQVKQLIYLSSDSIYGELNTDMVSEKVIMVNPGVYGMTKYLAEKIIMESGIPYYILRMPCVVGKIRRKNFISELVCRVRNNELIKLYNAEREFNNIVDIDDLIKFVLLLCQSERENCGEVLLLGNVENCQLIKIVSYVKELCHSVSPVQNVNTDEKRCFTLDVSKAVEYGYSSKKMEDIIKSLYQLQEGDF